MAYETGTALHAADLLQKFQAFAAGQGWSINKGESIGSGWQTFISKGSAFFSFRAFVNESMLVLESTPVANGHGICVSGSDGYNGSLAYNQQPGCPVRQDSPGNKYWVCTQFGVNPGPFTSYHFFAPDNKTLYAEIEVMAGVYQRFGCGSLDLLSTNVPGGGRFFYATSAYPMMLTGSNSYLVTDIDGSTQLEHVPFRGGSFSAGFRGQASLVRCAGNSFDNWAVGAQNARASVAGSSGSGSATDMAATGPGCHDRILRDFNPNPMNGVGILVPCMVCMNETNQYIRPIGTLPGIRYMDMTLYNPQAEFNLGADVWKVFPWYNKGGLSFQCGIAYKKVP